MKEALAAKFRKMVADAIDSGGEENNTGPLSPWNMTRRKKIEKLRKWKRD